MLFISSYVPLYVLLILKNILERCTVGGRVDISIQKIKSAHFFDEINDYAIIVLFMLCLSSIVYFVFLAKRRGGSHYYEIIHIEDQTGNIYFNYISVYLLSCLGLSLNNIVDVFVLLFLMILIGYIYISNHMTYMNPLLQIFGYKIYEGEVLSKSTKKTFESVILVKKDVVLAENNTYKGSGKDDFIYIVGKCDDK